MTKVFTLIATASFTLALGTAVAVAQAINSPTSEKNVSFSSAGQKSQDHERGAKPRQRLL